MTQIAPVNDFMLPHSILEHWQGHRRLTRRVIEAFPEEQLFAFSLGGMRSFGVMATEMLTMAAPTIRGVATGDWGAADAPDAVKPTSRAELLRLWDESTEVMTTLWPQIPSDRFHETMKAFGQWEMRVNDLVLYVIDNEIHHRGQGYVYLRALGIEPPAFWERA